ncbi:MAG: acetyl-CoA carboxylase carboxyltransferase subunit beta [Opitutales bacterium]|nr:acetyl-CoA carboxylase carboxyltransferase subunit beta [Opitutales bacterium]MCH8541187.1 acetyl-CoA carboxylase, carboxyltransferase subunit beta [Opitutales bacterium]
MPLFSKPKLFSNPLKKKDIPKGLYHKCPLCNEMVYTKELEENQMVVPQSGYHFPISPQKRLEALLDEESFTPMDEMLKSVDALKFQGVASYKEKLLQYQKKTGLMDAVLSGTGKITDIPVSIAVMDFRFLGASMGSVVGEKITRTIERALEQKIPCIVVSTSGGARMYEGILSLMQMAKTSAALARLKEARLPYISVLTNPTTAGVMASYASLGDVILAEPRALIGFAGPRVIKETTQQALPEGFQTAEFLLERGLVDQIVPRTEMRDRIAGLLKALYRAPSA